MAIYTNYNQINDYMKIGSAKDSCYVCAKKLGANAKRDAYDTMRALEGKVENKKVITIKKSGIDACICMDCVKEVYDEHIAPTLPKEEIVTPVVEVKEEVTTTETPVIETHASETKDAVVDQVETVVETKVETNTRKKK